MNDTCWSLQISMKYSDTGKFGRSTKKHSLYVPKRERDGWKSKQQKVPCSLRPNSMGNAITTRKRMKIDLIWSGKYFLFRLYILLCYEKISRILSRFLSLSNISSNVAVSLCWINIFQQIFFFVSFFSGFCLNKKSYFTLIISQPLFTNKRFSICFSHW